MSTTVRIGGSLKAARLMIVGAGGHALSLIHAVKRMECFEIVGLVDARRPSGAVVAGIRVLGDDRLLSERFYGDVQLAIGVGITAGSGVRKELYDRFAGMGYAFPAVCDPRAIVADDARLGEGVQIMPGAVVQAAATVERNAIVNTGAIVEHECVVGAHGHIGPGAVIGGNVRIGDCTMIGLGARILPGLRIGAKATIGAGAVVTRDVQDGAKVCGVPARMMQADS